LLAVVRNSTSLRVLASNAHSTDDQSADAQVLHTRSCSGVGMHFLHFLTACYLVFSLEHQSIAAALASLPPLKTSVALQLGTQPACSKSVSAPRPLQSAWCNFCCHCCRSCQLQWALPVKSVNQHPGQQPIPWASTAKIWRLFPQRLGITRSGAARGPDEDPAAGTTRAGYVLWTLEVAVQHHDVVARLLHTCSTGRVQPIWQRYGSQRARL